MIKSRTRIVILGGGYGGMMTAMRLAMKTRRHPVDITLINASDTFVERVRMHELAAGRPPKQHKIADILAGTGVNFVQAWVSAIDPDAHKVVLGDEGRVAYDTLVYALGSIVDQDAVPGVREYAYVLNPGGEHNANQLGEKLRALADSGGRVVVVGGGATGIEGASEIKGMLPKLDVQLITQGEFGAFKQNKQVEAYMRKSFQRLGIAIRAHTQVIEVQAERLCFADGTSVPFDLCVWAGGFKARPLARDAGIKVNDLGQILTDPYLRSVSHPEIFGVGDSAQPVLRPGAPMRMSVFVALVMGGYTAESLANQIKGKRIKPFSFAYYGQAISLGPGNAVGFATYPDDKPIGPIYKGKLAANLREFFVWFTAASIRLEKRIPGLFSWQGKGRVQRTLRKQAQSQAVEAQTL